MSATEEAIKIARVAAQAAHDKKGLDIVAFDVSEPLAIADIFLIVSANNERLVGAIVDEIEDNLIITEDLRPLRREGGSENRWVLLDYGDVVVHVQHTEERELYALERLWKDCPVVDLKLTDDESASGSDSPTDKQGPAVSDDDLAAGEGFAGARQSFAERDGLEEVLAPTGHRDQQAEDAEGDA